LSNGQGGSGDPLGLSFIALPQQNGSGASASGSFGGGSGFDPAAGSHGDPSFVSAGAAGRGDFAPRVAPGASSWQQHHDFGPGHAAWSGYDQPVNPAYSIIVLS
jgi:hypothetical protein